MIMYEVVSCDWWERF